MTTAVTATATTTARSGAFSRRRFGADARVRVRRREGGRGGIQRRGWGVVAMATKRCLVPMANGSEEMELVIVADVLRRAGAEVTIASVEETLQCECSRGVKICADAFLRDVATESFDLIALPGGMPGATRLAECQTLMGMLETQIGIDGAVTAAMCASPGVVLAPRGWLDDVASTAHPAFVKDLPSDASANARVVIDGDMITSRGPGTAIEFALALVEKLFGPEKAKEVAAPMVLPAPRDGNEIVRVPNEWRLEDAGLNK